MDLRSIFHRLNKFGLEAFQLYYSTYPAYVVENEDPLRQGRVLVLLGTILGPNSPPVWAYPKGQWSGDKCGMQILPEIKDLVWVEFQNGKITSPMWSYYYYQGGARPREFKSPRVYGLKTPKGYLVTIDDSEDTVLIQSPKGPVITMVGDMVGIKTSSNTITLDKDGISINSNTKDIHLYSDSGSVSITDSGVEIDTDKSINVGGQYPVLYSLIPGASSVVDLKEIGISTKVNVG